MKADIKYLEDKRSNAISRLNNSMNSSSIDSIEESFKSFIRIHKQWLLINDR